MKPGIFQSIFFTAALAAAAAAGADDAGTLIRAVPLQRGPSADSEVIAQLPEKTTVQIAGRQGAWLQVKWLQTKDGGGSTTTVGWVRLLAVRTAPATGSGDSGLTQAFDATRGGSTGSAVATGVRGLSKGDVQNATPNFDEAAKLETYAVTVADAQAFAKTPPPPLLQAQTVPYVDDKGAVEKGDAQ